MMSAIGGFSRTVIVFWAGLCSMAAQANFSSASVPQPPPPPIPGDSQGNPIMPSTVWSSASVQRGFNFINPTARRWFDPPPVDGFSIGLDRGSFLSVMAPTGFTGLKLRVNGVVVDESFNVGETFAFAPSVRVFDVFGITPALDPDAPGFASAFPLFLDFTGAPTTMTWHSLAAVPELPIFALLLLGIAGTALSTGALGRRRREA